MIIGLSGKKQSGKNTVAKMINFLATGGMRTYVGDNLEECFLGFSDYYADGFSGPLQYPFKEKLFADKVKDIVCMLISCTREQLEDERFKQTQLGDEWHAMVKTEADGSAIYDRLDPIIAHERFTQLGLWEQSYYRHRVMTPRLLLQLLGTNCGRNIIHPNIWVNALMSEYRPLDPENSQSTLSAIDYTKCKFPHWIITDVRFPNETKAIKDREGMVIRINREGLISDTHESETALDNYDKFNVTIDNNGTIVNLLMSVEKVLLDYELIS